MKWIDDCTFVCAALQLVLCVLVQYAWRELI